MGYANQMAFDLRRSGNLNAQADFQQQYMQALANLSRMGLDNSGFRTSQVQPAYQNLNMAHAQTEADISDRRLAWDQLELMKKQQEKKTPWWSILPSLGMGALGFGQLGSLLGLFGGKK